MYPLLQRLRGALNRTGGAGSTAPSPPTSNRGMNAAFHTAVGGLGKLAVCRYLVDVVRMVVNMWDTSPTRYRQMASIDHVLSSGNQHAALYVLGDGADLHQQWEAGDTVCN